MTSTNQNKPNLLIRLGTKLDNAKKKIGAFGPYLKLQLGLSFKPSKVTKKSKVVWGWVAKGVVFALALLFLFYFTHTITNSAGKIIRGDICLIIYVTIAQLIILIYSISSQIKRLYRPDDLKLILSYPISSFGRYLAEILAIYLKMLIYSVVIFWSFLLIYGGSASIDVNGKATLYLVAYPAQYLFSSLFGAILLPFIPFALSLIITIPFIYLSSWLSNKNIVKLILFIVLFIVILIAYAFILRLLANLFVQSQVTAELFKKIKQVLINFNQPYNICYFTSQLCLGIEVGKNFGIILAIGVAAAAIGILITRPLYNKFTSSGAIVERVDSIRKVKISNNGPYKEMFVKEFKQILRTPSYAYFFVGVAIALPLITLIISQLIKTLGREQMGSSAYFGFCLLTILTIISLIGSYSANIISREGGQFYITKISPLPYRNQMLVKIAVNFIVAYAALLLSLVCIGATSIVARPMKETPGITWTDFGFLILISTFFLIGITFNGAMLELWRPKVNLMGSSNNETNIIIQLIISILVAALISSAIILCDEIYTNASLYFHLGGLGVTLVYALAFFLVFWFTSNKRYRDIEIK